MDDRKMLEATFWDLYRDVHGTRPRLLATDSMTDEELRRRIEFLVLARGC